MEIASQIDRLRQSPDPWVRLGVLRDIDCLAPDDLRCAALRAEIVAHPLVRRLFDDLSVWPGVVLSSHKSAGQLYHKMAFLADIGLTVEDGPLLPLIEKVLDDLSAEGIPRLSTSISSAHGGSGQPVRAWALCDAPLQLWTLLKMHSGRQDVLLSAVRQLAGLCRDNGWPCVVSPELAPFRGPGKASDPCPYATLLMTRLLLLPQTGLAGSEWVATGARVLLDLWQNSLTQHPYIFYMGNDFRKIKAPFIWYDLLHVTDVLSQIPAAARDTRTGEMIGLLRAKAGPDGRYTPESVWKAWDGWDFAQKGRPSDWLTFLVLRILARVETAERRQRITASDDKTE